MRFSPPLLSSLVHVIVLPAWFAFVYLARDIHCNYELCHFNRTEVIASLPSNAYPNISVISADFTNGVLHSMIVLFRGRVHIKIDAVGLGRKFSSSCVDWMEVPFFCHTQGGVMSPHSTPPINQTRGPRDWPVCVQESCSTWVKILNDVSHLYSSMSNRFEGDLVSECWLGHKWLLFKLFSVFTPAIRKWKRSRMVKYIWRIASFSGIRIVTIMPGTCLQQAQ